MFLFNKTRIILSALYYIAAVYKSVIITVPYFLLLYHMISLGAWHSEKKHSHFVNALMEMCIIVFMLYQHLHEI